MAEPRQSLAWDRPPDPPPDLDSLADGRGEKLKLADPGISRGLAAKAGNRRLKSGIGRLDLLLGGGVARGKISEFIGRPGSGRTTLAAAFGAAATRRGEVVGWIDAANAFDPASIAATGVDLARVLWIGTGAGDVPAGAGERPFAPLRRRQSTLLKAAELVLDAGGFGLVIVDFGALRYPLPQSAALRIARAAERSGAAVIALGPRRMCGTFASLSLAITRARASFRRSRPGAPAIFDGLELEVGIARNKLGGSDGRTSIRANVDSIEQRSLPFGDAADRDSGTGVAMRPEAFHGSGN